MPDLIEYLRICKLQVHDWLTGDLVRGLHWLADLLLAKVQYEFMSIAAGLLPVDLVREAGGLLP